MFRYIEKLMINSLTGNKKIVNWMKWKYRIKTTHIKINERMDGKRDEWMNKKIKQIFQEINLMFMYWAETFCIVSPHLILAITIDWATKTNSSLIEIHSAVLSSK